MEDARSDIQNNEYSVITHKKPLPFGSPLFQNEQTEKPARMGNTLSK
jgi:hypothetical protein